MAMISPLVQLHLKRVISQKAECVPDGQESLPSPASLSGLRDAGEAEGKHAES